MELALLNSSTITAEGVYRLEDISLQEAKKLVLENEDNLDSAIGHTSTAEILTELLNTEIERNRQHFVQKKGQQALLFKLLGRPEEGKILTSVEIEAIGYKFQLLTRIG